MLKYVRSWKLAPHIMLKNEAICYLMKKLMTDWPEQKFLSTESCKLPPHLACIQLLENPPTLSPTNEKVQGARWIYLGLKSMDVNVELLLGTNPHMPVWTIVEKQ